MEKVNLAQKLSLFDEQWQPKVVGEVNDSYVKLVKVQGEFVWHHHGLEDELFLVLHGRLCIQFRDGDVWLEPGEFLIVPHGVEHCPVAIGETCEVMLIEPGSTVKSGSAVMDRAAILQRPALPR